MPFNIFSGRDQLSCPMRGCRAPEVAAGALLQVLDEALVCQLITLLLFSLVLTLLLLLNQ